MKALTYIKATFVAYIPAYCDGNELETVVKANRRIIIQDDLMLTGCEAVTPEEFQANNCLYDELSIVYEADGTFNRTISSLLKSERLTTIAEDAA